MEKTELKKTEKAGFICPDCGEISNEIYCPYCNTFIIKFCPCGLEIEEEDELCIKCFETETQRNQGIIDMQNSLFQYFR